MSELRIVKFSEMTLIKLGLRNDKLYFKDEADKAIAHQKYKRCLAMAKWCAADCVVNQNTYKKFLTHKSEFRITHFRKWYFRWLELAEKFSKGENRCRYREDSFD